MSRTYLNSTFSNNLLIDRWCSISKSVNHVSDQGSDENKLATFLNYKFSSLGSYIGPSPPYSNSLSTNDNQPEFSFEPISEYTCIKIIDALKVNKPLGLWCIPAWTLDCFPVNAENLTFLMNAFILEKHFPRHLKLSHITPIHKKGDD